MGTVVLHIDDEATLPDGVAATLRREGYELLHTADAEEAIGLFERRRPGLVLIEPQLAGCDGLDLLDGMRAREPEGARVPVLVLTRAPRSSGLVGEVIARGALDILSHPVLPSQLLASIRELAPLAPERRPEPAAAAGDLSGDLCGTPLPELLARLRRRGATGVLIASRGRRRLVVQLRNGSPAAVSTTRLRGARRDGDSAPGADDSGDAETQLFEAFRWTHGSYRFSGDRQVRRGAALEISRDARSLLLAGVLARSPTPLVRDRLHKLASLYATAVEEEDCPLEDLELTPAQRQRLAETGGDATLGELLAEAVFDERLLYGLWVAGRLELRTTPTLVLTEVLEGGDNAPAPDPGVASGGALGDESGVGLEYDSGRDLGDARSDSAADAAGDSAPAEAPRTDEERLRALAQQVLVSDDFDALDVPIFAPDRQIRAAYERLLAAIPEGVRDSPDAEVRERAARIRKRIEAAYENVKDPETRRSHALLRREEEQDRDVRVSAERSLEAERWFRKGQGFLESRRFEEATEAFGMASHLDPEEGEYLAHLGYALFLTNSDDEVVQQEATEHIANGIKRSPSRALSYVYLGRILRVKGDAGTARKLFRRALRANASCYAAQQELRLLEMRERSRGLLSRLWRR